MRRIIIGSMAFMAMTGSVLVLPVYAAPGPEPEPVVTSTDEVVMGSVDDPAPQADVQAGTTDPVAGVAASAPTLTVAKPDVDEFSLVGVTWAHDPAVTDTLVQVRVREAGGNWGRWSEVGVEDAEQDPNADSGAAPRGGTSPLWTGPSTGVEVELVTRSGARPTDVQLDLIDPGTSEADATIAGAEVTDTANADTGMPAVATRAQWGADETLRTWDPQYAATLKAATLHHTADSNNYTADQVPAIMRSIYRYHAVSRGWGDIGYHVVVDKYGRMWEGRSGGLASTVIGAHAGGFNAGTFGVSMLGNYDIVDTPAVMIEAVSAIIAWKLSLFGVDPTGSTVLTSAGGGTSRFAAGESVTVRTVFGHKDVGSTACPGRYGFAKLGEIRSRAAGITTAASLVSALYADVLGRAPGEAELDGWARAVAKTGDRWVAVRGFSGSEEYRRRFVTEVYLDILGRAPESGAAEGWVKEIAAGRMTLDKLRTTFMLSPEFYLQGGGTEEGFVNLIYQRAFQRSASLAEQALWANTSRTKGRAETIRGIWDSYESALHRVDRSYQRWLARPASSSERDYWSGMIIRAGDESMREAALVSPEYLTRAITRFP